MGYSIMKSIVSALCLLAVASSAMAAPQTEDRVVAILTDERVDSGDGNFNYAFTADNGVEMQVAGTPGAEGGANMQGSYVMPLEDGTFARVEFVADANGFQPQSDILPTPHPIPEHVQELLRIAEQQRAEGITFDNFGRRI